MNVFLDVGAHTGETLRAALDRRYSLHKIVCFEPVPSCWGELARYEDPRVSICKFGLWKETTRLPIHDPGHLGASIYADARSNSDSSHIIELRAASDWFRENIEEDDHVFLKLNCEGSECDILDDLMDSGEIGKVHSALIDFDVLKTPSQRHREQETRIRLEEQGTSYFVKDEMKGSTHIATIDNWLTAAGATEDRHKGIWWVQYVMMPATVRWLIPRFKRVARAVLPGVMYNGLRRIVHRFVFRY